MNIQILSIKNNNKYSDFQLNETEKKSNAFVEIIYENFKDKQTLNVSLSVFDDKDNYLIASPNLDRKKLEKRYDLEISDLLARARYGAVRGIVSGNLKRGHKNKFELIF